MKLFFKKDSFKTTIKTIKTPLNSGFASLYFDDKRTYFTKKKIKNHTELMVEPNKYENKFEQPQVFFPFIPIRVAEYNKKKNMLILHTPPNYGKVDLKYYLRQVYNIEITKINSLNVMGKVKRPYQYPRGRPYRMKSYKKFYITLSENQSSSKIKEALPEDLLEEVVEENNQNQTKQN